MIDIKLTVETSTDQMVGNYPMVVGDDGLYRNLQDFKKNGNEQSDSEKSLTRVWCVNTASASRNSGPC